MHTSAHFFVHTIYLYTPQCLVAGGEGNKICCPTEIPADVFSIITKKLDEEKSEIELNLCELMKSSTEVDGDAEETGTMTS